MTFLFGRLDSHLGLIFATPPTYEELSNGTISLSPLFNLNEDFKTSVEVSVSPGRLELPTISLRGRCSTS